MKTILLFPLLDVILKSKPRILFFSFLCGIVHDASFIYYMEDLSLSVVVRVSHP